MIVRDESLGSSYFHNPYSFIRALRVTPSPSQNSELEAARMLNETLLQQNEQNNQIIQQIWLELQKKKENKKKRRKVEHGAKCNCKKCYFRRAQKGKQLLGKSKINQTDGNDTATETESSNQPGTSSKSGSLNQPETLSQPGTSNQPKTLNQAGPSKKRALKRSATSKVKKPQRPAKTSAKKLLALQRDSIGDDHNSGKDPDYEETDEDFSDDEENDSIIESSDDEDFHSLPSQTPEDIVEREAESQKKSPFQCPTAKPELHTTRKLHPTPTTLESDIPENEKCFVEHFDLEIVATKIDQLSHPGTFRQAPADYFRFLSTCVFFIFTLSKVLQFLIKF